MSRRATPTAVFARARRRAPAPPTPATWATPWRCPTTSGRRQPRRRRASAAGCRRPARRDRAPGPRAERRTDGSESTAPTAARPRGGRARRRAAVVARGGDDQDALAPRIGDAVGQHRRRLAAAEAEIDDARTVIGRPDDACSDVDIAARASGVEHLDRQDRGLRSDAGLGQAVALDLRHGAGDMGAVPVVVRRVVAAGDHVPAREQTSGEVGSGGHARVDDGDDDAGAARDRPRRRDADGVETPLLRAPRIGCRDIERLQAADGLGETHGARAPQRAQAAARWGRRHVDDDARAGAGRRRSGWRLRPRAPSRRRRPAAGRRRWRRLRAPRPEGAGRPARRGRARGGRGFGGGMRERCRGSRDGAGARRAGCVTLRAVDATSPHVRRVARAGVLALCDRLDHTPGRPSTPTGKARFETAGERVEITPPFRFEHWENADRIDTGPLRAHLTSPRRVGLLVVRLGGYGAGVYEDERLVSGKHGVRFVKNRNKKGGLLEPLPAPPRGAGARRLRPRLRTRRGGTRTAGQAARRVRAGRRPHRARAGDRALAAAHGSDRGRASRCRSTCPKCVARCSRDSGASCGRQASS